MEQYQRLNIGFKTDIPIQSPLLDKSLESAQKKVESFYFDTRKQLFEYDEAINVQRNNIYDERRRLFKKKNLRIWIIECAELCCDDLCDRFEILGDSNQIKLISLKLQNLLSTPFQNEFYRKNIPQDLSSYLKQQVEIAYDLKEVEMELIEGGLLRELEKSFVLQQIDNAWTEHLQKISFLRDSIRWIAY